LGLISNIFWIGLIIVFYTYIGYGIVIYLVSKVRKRFPQVPDQPDTGLPPVTFLVAAYNEADFIEEKILNTLSLEYPSEKLRLLFVTDGSTDNTQEIITIHRKLSGSFHKSGYSTNLSEKGKSMQ
jgi:poly-beta-1,6-N-acetyl-D-glucosamine synthase